MGLPKEIKIQNHIYKLFEVSEIKDSTVTKPNEDGSESQEFIYGLLDDGALTILILKELHPTRKYQILWHELVHAICNNFELIRFLKDPELEESIVNAVSEGICQILTDNPQLKITEFAQPTIEDDKAVAEAINFNYSEGVSIKQLAESFHRKPKEVKEFLEKMGAVARKEDKAAKVAKAKKRDKAKVQKIKSRN